MSEELWDSPTATGPVDAVVSVPGSKSLANRALVLAALADGPARISGLPLRARDIWLMIEALRALGCDITVAADGVVTVTPAPLSGPAQIDCGLAGTVMRFVPPVAALATGPVDFDGDPRARERPMAAVLAALRTLGVSVDDGGRGSLPFRVDATGRVPGGPVTVDASGSSQFVSALLLSGARFDAGVTVRHSGPPVPSLPHIDMTCRLLAERGVSVESDTRDRENAVWRVAPGEISACDYTVEPDLSNAAPLAAAAMVAGGRVVIRDWPADSAQPAAELLDVLRTMGARTRAVPAGMEIAGDRAVHGLTADLRDIGELVPSIAALCALADSPSELTGIGHIAGHETDRLAALTTQINALGGTVTALPDGLRIEPRPLHGGVWATYHDHRMATAGAIIGLRVPGVRIENIATTAKTFATFPTVWRFVLGLDGLDPKTTAAGPGGR